MNETTSLCIALFNSPSVTLFDFLFAVVGCGVIGWVGRMLYDTYREEGTPEKVNP